MSDSEEATMILLPVKSGPQHVAADSAPLTAGCGHRAWIAPSGVAYMAANPATRTICMDCVDTSQIEPDKVHEIPGQMDEIRAEVGNIPQGEELLSMLRALFSQRK